MSSEILSYEKKKQYLVMEFLLEGRSKICGHLTNGITSCISNSGMLKERRPTAIKVEEIANRIVNMKHTNGK